MDIKQYIPDFYNRNDFTYDQNEVIKNALEKFNELSDDRGFIDESDKDEFIKDLLNPSFTPQEMQQILNVRIEIFNYVTDTMNNAANRDVKKLNMLTDKLQGLIEKATNEVALKQNLEEKIASFQTDHLENQRVDPDRTIDIDMTHFL